MVATGTIIKMYLEAILNTDLHQDSILATIPLHPSSDVTDLFTCNLPPSDATRSAVLVKIQQYEHFIFLVNSYGHHIDVKWQSSIILERAKAKNLIISLRLIVHLICFVPDDILLGIFAVVIDTTCISSVVTNMDLWACSRICQQWCTLVLCAPLLWADVHLDFDDDVYLRYCLSHAERIFTEHLERSSNNLLDVYVHGPCADPDTNTVLSCLLMSATRWWSLTVDAGPEVYGLFKNCPGGSLSELCTLSITDSIFMDGNIDEKIDMSASSLRHSISLLIYADCSYLLYLLHFYCCLLKPCIMVSRNFPSTCLIRLLMSHVSYQQCRHWCLWIFSAMQFWKATVVWSACLWFLI